MTQIWKIIGLPWPSSRMSNQLYYINKSKILHNVVKKQTKIKKENHNYDKILGVNFPSSRFN